MHLPKSLSSVASLLAGYFSPRPSRPQNLGPFPGKPSLDGARERVSRARDHIDELKRVIGAIQVNRSAPVEMQLEGRTGTNTDFETPDIPPRVSAIVGDICYNLRAALDYLVFSLSGLDSGLDFPMTQFPIERRNRDFTGRVKAGWLGGMNAAHKTAIQGLQPYRGNDWATALKNISNPDKHRRLTATKPDISISGTIGFQPDADTFPIGNGMHMKIVTTFLVQLPDGTPVIETLEKIQLKVSETLDAFEPEFK
jgi:hypothetical protein